MVERITSPDQQRQEQVEQQNIPQVTRDARGRILWKLPGNTTEQNEQLGIANIQALFLEKFPEFNGLFPKGEDGKILEEKRDEAERFIIDHLVSRKSFTGSFGSSPTSRRLCSYFLGSHLIVITRSFASWGLNLQESNPWIFIQVDDETEKYIDQQGKAWTPTQFFLRKFGIGSKLLACHLREVDSIDGRSRTGQKTNLYNEEQVNQQLRNLISLPKVDKTDGIYTDSDGERWAPAYYFFRKLSGVGNGTVSKLLEKTRSIKGRGKSGFEVTLFNHQEAVDVLKAYLEPPIVDKETFKYTDEEGESWVTIATLSKELGLSHSSLSIRLNGVSFINGKDVSGHKAVLFNEKEAKKKLQGIVDLPHVSDSSRIFTDKNGENWTTLNYFSKEFGLSYTVLTRHLKSVRSQLGVGGDGHETILYSLEDSLHHIRKLLFIPRLDKNGIFIDKDGKKWAPLRFFRDKFRVNHSTLVQMKKSVSFIEGKDKNGRIRQLYNFEELIEIIKSKRAKIRPNGYWKDVQNIEREARKFLSEGHVLSENELEKNDFSSLVYAISKYYPGGIRALKEKLGILVATSRIDISSEEANEALRKLLEEQ